MSIITKEQAKKIIDAADEVITALAGTNEDVHPDNSTKMVRLYDDLNDYYAPPEVVRELARIALASLEAEPDCYVVVTSVGVWQSFCKTRAEAEFIVSKPFNPGYSIREIYTTPPAPVSVPDYPETLPCPVMLEPGLHFGRGVPTKTMLGALQRRAEHYAELEAMTPEQRAEHEAGMKEFAAMLQGADGALTNEDTRGNCKHLLPIGELIYRLEEQTGDKWIRTRNAIPDGYALVPIEPTEDMIVEGFESAPNEDFSDPAVWKKYQAMSGCQQAAHRARLCWAAMIASAPSPEMK